MMKNEKILSGTFSTFLKMLMPLNSLVRVFVATNASMFETPESN